MKRHQVLTGAVNQGSHCFAVGGIASFTFWAYGSGCDLVILGVDLKPIHVIPGNTNDNKLIVCIDCSQICGKIAVSYEKRVVIYRPILKSNLKNNEIPVFTWEQEAVIDLDYDQQMATVVSWSSNGERLLIASDDILLYGQNKQKSRSPARKPKFSIEILEEEDESEDETGDVKTKEKFEWKLLWRSGIRENLRELNFSPDGEMFASVGYNDTTIKVWHQRTQLPPFVKSDDNQSHGHYKEPSIDFTYFYLVHPQPVVGFSWRKSVPLLEPGSVSNMLISSCCDNMCRIWSETIVPKEDVTTISALAFSNPQHKSHHHKPHIKEHLKLSSVKKSVSEPAMRANFQPKHTTTKPEKNSKKNTFKHFHISATINPVSDIPLLPSISPFDSSKCASEGEDSGQVFTVHWLDNKYHNAMAMLNQILKDAMSDNNKVNKHEMGTKDKIHNEEEDAQSHFYQSRPDSLHSIPEWDSRKPESVDTFLSCLASPVSPELQEDLGLKFPQSISEELLRNWRRQSDALFAIHPNDGSLLVWHVNYLGENEFGRIRQPQVSFSSRIPMAIPAGDASTICSRVVLYANHYSDHFSINTNSGISHSTTSSSMNEAILDNNDPTQPETATEPTQPSSFIHMLSKQTDGSLNQWEMSFTPNTAYSMISSIRHISRFCGHRFHLSGICCHPTLPLLLTTAHHYKGQVACDTNNAVKSELIFWRVDTVGALLHSGGITELARLNGTSQLSFRKVEWFPVLFPSWCLGVESVSTSTCLVSLNDGCIEIYQAVVNASKLLVQINELSCQSSISEAQDKLLEQAVSEQSSDHPGCLLKLSSIQLEEDIEEIISFTVLQDDQLNNKKNENNDIGQKRHYKFVSEKFFLLLLLKPKNGRIVTRMWKIHFHADQHAIPHHVRTRRNTIQMMSPDTSDEESDTNDPSMIDDTSSWSVLQVKITEANTMDITLPNKVDVLNVCAAADPLAVALTNRSQNIPFTLSLSCSDGAIYFIKVLCGENGSLDDVDSFAWIPWYGADADDVLQPLTQNIVLQSPFLQVTDYLISMKLAHCGMLATLSCEESFGEIIVYLSIFDCLASGGARWVLQDKMTILKLCEVSEIKSFDDIKQFIQLDWFSCEDGSYLLAVCIGSVVKIFSRVPVGLAWEERQMSVSDESYVWSQETGKGNVPSYKTQTPKRHPLVKRQSTLDVVSSRRLFGPYHEKKLPGSRVATEANLQWSQLTEILLTNEPLPNVIKLSSIIKQSPVMISWVRDGFLIAATDTEMHVFCHWLEKNPCSIQPSVGIIHGEASILESGSSGLFEHLKHHNNAAAQFGCLETDESVVSVVGLPDDLSPTLPQYHPLVLTELMNGGHLVAVKRILIEMARCMNGESPQNEYMIHDEKLNLKKFNLESEDAPDTGLSIMPVLLYEILATDGKINNVQEMLHVHNHPAVQCGGKTGMPDMEYDELFTTQDDTSDGSDLEDFMANDKTDAKSQCIVLSNLQPGYLGEEHCKVIHNYLEHNQLPGLSGMDQMELMALADTIAHGHSDQVETSKTILDRGSEGRGYASIDEAATASLDKCGLRFVLAVHNHLCLLRSLPAIQGAKLLKRGLETCHFAWAFHSDAQEEALAVIPSVLRGAPEWEELRSFGAVWWIRSLNTLRRLIEQTARAAFQKDNNPLDAALYYMALDKKNVIKGLFKSVRDSKMCDFFSNNFSEPRWRKAALKNAFALMGKQRFKEAVAFFLLANSVKDALEVCIEKLSDFQLACAIVRLNEQEGSVSTYHDLLNRYVIQKQDKILGFDPFIRSMTYWSLGNYNEALWTLVDNEQVEECKNLKFSTKITDVFNFYNFLRTHPMLIKQRKIEQNQEMGSDQDVDDSITPKERELFFATAKTHLDTGCALLALDVLSRLPAVKYDNNKEDKRESELDAKEKKQEQKNEKASDMDWGVSLDSEKKNADDELELDWSEDENSSSSSSEDFSKDEEIKEPEDPTPLNSTAKDILLKANATSTSNRLKNDVFTQQLRLCACMKVFVLELKGIAQACAHNGGQLRNQLYLWLEKETKVLHSICHGDRGCDIVVNCDQTINVRGDISHVDEDVNAALTDSDEDILKRVPSLHELYIAEKQDWKFKRDNASHRRKWLRRYQHFLRTLLSYCALHDDAKGSLVTMRMELLLLLQESMQEKTPHQQLASPLPLPTTVPLLSSSVVSCQTVVADPSSRLKHMINDIYASILTFTEAPLQFGCDNVDTFTLSLCHQANALSLCVYHSLCDMHSKTYRNKILDVDHHAFDYSSLSSGNNLSPRANSSLNHPQRSHANSTSDAYMAPNTLPAHWPGVASLQTMLNTESTTGDKARHLIILLCEAMTCVYVTLLVRGLHTCNTKLLYRLVTHNLSKQMWNAVFGGGARMVVKYSKPFHGHGGTKDRVSSNIREKLNRRVLTHERQGSHTSNNSETGSYREKYVAPEISLWDWFLLKPLEARSKIGDDYYDSDSDSSIASDSSDDDDFDDDFDFNMDDDMTDDPFKYNQPKAKKVDQDTQEGNLMSYSWHILRLAIIRIVIHNLKTFLPSCGLEINELGTTTPVLSSILRLLHQWQSQFQTSLNNFEGVPETFTNLFSLSLERRPSIIKHKQILDITPFGNEKDSCGIKRLWKTLIRKEMLQEMFIYFIFEKASKKRIQEKLENTTTEDMNTNEESKKVMNNTSSIGKVKVLHKETEIITSFCINHTNPNIVVISTTQDLLELDLSSILASDSWSWMEEDVSSPVNQSDTNGKKDEEFLLVSRKASMVPPSAMAPPIYVPMSTNMQTGQGGNIVMRRQNYSARRMCSHPNLPYYLTGHHDGDIRMWEWGHQQQISLFSSGHHPKVNNVHFTPFGNKVAAVDVEGFLTMWQVSSPRKPFLLHQCHDRSTSDCCFIASSSVVATTGMSSTHRNVAVWDTLLPTRSMLIHEFTLWENIGASCVEYAPQYNSLVVGGRDGRIAAFDMRRMVEPVCSFTAHDTAIKCLAVSPDGRYYVTGSVGGDMRVWDTQSHSLIYRLHSEHPRASLFRNFGSGTMQIAISEPLHQVYSCGADGTLKLRMLPNADNLENVFGDPLGGIFQKLALQRQVIKLAETVREQCMVY